MAISREIAAFPAGLNNQAISANQTNPIILRF